MNCNEPANTLHKKMPLGDMSQSLLSLLFANSSDAILPETDAGGGLNVADDTSR